MRRMGRTAKSVCHQWAGIVPDDAPGRRAWAPGVPIGAVVAGPRPPTCCNRATMAPPFGGNQLTHCAQATNHPHHGRRRPAGDAAQPPWARAPEVGLQRELGSLPGVKEIRGQGPTLGIELNKPCGALTSRAADAGLLISVTADVIRLVPSLILTVWPRPTKSSPHSPLWSKPSWRINLTRKRVPLSFENTICSSTTSPPTNTPTCFRARRHHQEKFKVVRKVPPAGHRTWPLILSQHPHRVSFRRAYQLGGSVVH